MYEPSPTPAHFHPQIMLPPRTCEAHAARVEFQRGESTSRSASNPHNILTLHFWREQKGQFPPRSTPNSSSCCCPRLFFLILISPISEVRSDPIQSAAMASYEYSGNSLSPPPDLISLAFVSLNFVIFLLKIGFCHVCRVQFFERSILSS